MKAFFSLAAAFTLAVTLLSIQPAVAADSVKAMEAYKAVLQNNMTFYNTNDQKHYKLSEFDYWGEDSYLPLKVVSFAVVDMDGDGVPEVILELTSGFDGSFEVLHYEDGQVYGFNHPYRGIIDLTSDGIYWGSDGAADGGFYKASISKSRYETTALGYSESAADESVTHYIDGTKVSDAQYNEFLEKMWAHARENKAVWYDFIDSNIASAFK